MGNQRTGDSDALAQTMHRSFRSWRRAPIIASCLVCVGALAQSAAGQQELTNLVIQDVHILAAGAPDEARLVNVQIIDGKVALISEDEIPIDAGSAARLANDGFLLGRLTIGASPSFIILDEDPTGNLQILADTSPHVRFAVEEGAILVDLLDAAPPQVSVEEAPQRRQWIAYTPPPISLSTAIDVDQKWNAFDTRHFDGLVIGAVRLDRANWLSQNDGSRTQPGIGELTEYSGGSIRAFRLGVGGTIKRERPWVYSIGGAANAFDQGFDSEDSDSFTFFDYRLDIPVAEKLTLSVGKQKEPISLERTMTLIQAPVQERSAAADAMMPTRNFGLVVSGMHENGRMTWASGVFNDWLEAGESLSESASQAVGRVTWLPVISDDESNLIHLGAGVRYTNAKQGLRYKSRPEIGVAPSFVDTELFDANASTLYSLEAAWRTGPYWVTAEYISNDVDAPQFANPTFTGYHIAGTWALTGEMRAYNRRSGVLSGLPVAQNIQQGGYGAVELALRWSEIDLSDGLIDGGEMQIATLGVNWWLTNAFSISLNYQNIWSDRAGITGRSDALVTSIFLATD